MATPLDPPKPGPPRPDPRTDIGHVHLKVADLDRALAFYRDVLGFELTSRLGDHAVSEAIYLHDPDGKGIELHWDRPREEWPKAADGSYAMGVEALDLDDLLAAATAEAT